MNSTIKLPIGYIINVQAKTSAVCIGNVYKIFIISESYESVPKYWVLL